MPAMCRGREAEIAAFRRDQALTIPADFDYLAVKDCRSRHGRNLSGCGRRRSVMQRESMGSRRQPSA